MNRERAPWDRRDGEPIRAYDGFRRYRDLGPLRMLRDVPGDVSSRTIERWSARWDWHARAVAWDDEQHATADRARIEAIRTMHDQHAKAGRAVMSKALAALAAIPTDQIPPAAAARLLEIGARLERDTLTVSVEQLQGVISSITDPFEAIARELEDSSG